LGGLDIPLLTVTDPTVDNKKKKCIVLSARIHPGEPCGSYMMKGFLNFILSEKDEAKYLRERIVFKLIPMLNPDGVTIGNFRTSLCGKDLNRTFKLPN
jgi:murein tripeptide amidase MpaA